MNNFYIDQSILPFAAVGIQPLYTENTDFKSHTEAIHGIISAIQYQWSFSNLLLSSAWWFVSKSSKGVFEKILKIYTFYWFYEKK